LNLLRRYDHDVTNAKFERALIRVNILGKIVVATTTELRWRKNHLSIVGAFLCVALSACAQSAGNRSAGVSPVPGTGVAATSDPLVLNGVASTQSANASTPIAPSPSRSANVVAAPSGGVSQPVVSATPVAPVQPTISAPMATTAVSPSTATPAAPAAPPAQVGTASATTADGYPNINVTPKQPQSQLLTPEERAKLIEELNALAGRSAATQ
jgi:hypothetical protein